MRDLFSQLLAIGPELAAFILTAPLLGSRGVYAVPASVSSPNLDLSQLGRVALGGDFDSISLYSYQGQRENGFSTNGSQALLTQLPNGAFQPLDMSDASIAAMCPFVLSDGALQGVVVAGNFTSLGGVEAQSVALFNPNTSQVTPLPGLTGVVNAVYCDQAASAVYVGGSFIGGNSTNAMAWTTGWVNLPFAGFNGPVNSITKNSAGNIVFGGDFDGLGNASSPRISNGQVVNLNSGNTSASGTTTNSGFTDPSQIICQTGTDGPGNTWLLNDNSPGWWQSSFAFGFRPTKLRLYNTAYQGRGTKMFYFEDLNSGGILNMSYVDVNGTPSACTNECPMPQGNTTYQDFYFSPSVGMDEFRIWITQWYGAGGGLAGVEMFQDDIYSFAVSSFNEPKCDGVSLLGSNSTANPNNNTWVRLPNLNKTSSDYLSATLTSPEQISPSTNVIFEPDIQESGNYSIMIYTPGCILDNTCKSRGQVTLSGTLSATGSSFQSSIYQTNDYDKYDEIYSGYVDATTSSFRPTVTLAPLAGQTAPLTVVAQRVGFMLISTTGGLNGLYEYNSSQASVNTDFSTSAINQAGSSLQPGATINALAVSGSTLYAVGHFSGNGISNALSVAGGNATALPGGGLNSDVMALYQNGSVLYMGGNFTNTADSASTGLNGVAAFSISANAWTALGAGVNGAVTDIVPLPLNITAGNLVDCVTVTGSFTSVNAFSGSAAYNASGFAVWVPSLNNWLANIANSTTGPNGDLVAFTEVPGSSSLYAGDITSQALELTDAVELVGSGQPSIQSFGIQLQQVNSSSTQKRALSASSNGQNYTGVYDGLFYSGSNLNITVLGGNFATMASNGSTVENLVLINDTAAQTVSGVNGIDSSSIFVTMDTQGTHLWAGGAVTGSANGNPVNGLIVYDLAANTFVSPSPPALSGNDVIVNAIATQPSGSDVYVGGSFTGAGSLPCSTLCYYDTSSNQWNPAGNGLSGTINYMLWASSTSLVIAGNITVGGNATTMATYDAKAQTFQEYTGASTLPGPIVAMSPADTAYDQFWAAGVATANGSTYLYKYASGVWTAASGLGDNTVIRGLQVMGVTSNHDNSALMPNNQVLMLTGNINIPGFGNASAALFNGTSYEPFVLTNLEDGSSGTIAQIFASNPQNFMTSSNNELALGLIVLIGLAIALGLIFLVVVAGILIERHRRRREGYVPMTTDKTSNMSRLPPETLFANLKEKGSPPRI